MLIDKKGRQFDPKKLSEKRPIREKQLSQLREVYCTTPRHGRLFNLGERARLIE